jgi:hypothetical protein
MSSRQKYFSFACWAQLALSLVTVAALLMSGLTVMSVMMAVVASVYVVMAAAAFGGNRFIVTIVALLSLAVGASAMLFVSTYVAGGFDFLTGRFSLPPDFPVVVTSAFGEVTVLENAPPELRAQMTPFDPLAYVALLVVSLVLLVAYGHTRAWLLRTTHSGSAGSHSS